METELQPGRAAVFAIPRRKLFGEMENSPRLVIRTEVYTVQDECQRYTKSSM